MQRVEELFRTEPKRISINGTGESSTITPKNIELRSGAKILIKPGDFRNLKKKWFKYIFDKEEREGYYNLIPSSK